MKKIGVLLLLVLSTMVLTGCKPKEYLVHESTLLSSAGYVIDIGGTKMYVDNQNKIIYFDGDTLRGTTHIIDFSGKTVYGYIRQPYSEISYDRYVIEDEENVNDDDFVLDIFILCENKWSADNYQRCETTVSVDDLPESITEMIREVDLYPTNTDRLHVDIFAMYNSEDEMLVEITIDLEELIIAEYNQDVPLLFNTKLEITFELLDEPNFEIPDRYTDTGETISIEDFFAK
jgi:hypothetical protein